MYSNSSTDALLRFTDIKLTKKQEVALELFINAASDRRYKAAVAYDDHLVSKNMSVCLVAMTTTIEVPPELEGSLFCMQSYLVRRASEYLTNNNTYQGTIRFEEKRDPMQLMKDSSQKVQNVHASIYWDLPEKKTAAISEAQRTHRLVSGQGSSSCTVM